MSVTVDIISIGTLSRNVFWNETGARRAAHATVTLIRDGGTSILVDPSLPESVLRYRLDERAGLSPDQIDIVFLTNFRPVHRLGLSTFQKAEWLISEVERDAATLAVSTALSAGSPPGVELSLEEIEAEAELLGRLECAPERLSELVDFFPTYGATPGNSGLLVKGSRTVVVAGDAIVSRDHFDHGRIWERSIDPDRAKEAFVELCEIADVIVPGHDNILFLG